LRAEKRGDDLIGELLTFIGMILLCIAGVLDGISMRKFELGVLERVERFGNFIRCGSLISSSGIFLTWLLLTRQKNDDLLPHVIMIVIAAAVILAWGCYYEQKRLSAAEAPWIFRSTSLFGTPGLITLQCGGIIWAASDGERFYSIISFGFAVLCAGTALIASLLGLLWLYLKHVKTGSNTFRPISPGEIDWNAVRRK
jgi:hypothetical protein